MNAISNVTWLLPHLVLPTFYTGISILMYYIQPKKANIQYSYQNSVSIKNQENWLTANQTALNYFLYTSIVFLIGLTVFSFALGKTGVEKWFGGSPDLFIIICCNLIIVMPNVVRKYKLKQISISKEKNR